MVDDIQTYCAPQQTFSGPQYVWRLFVCGGVESGFSISFTKENTPCRFHRKMQELILGFKWEKI